MRRLAEQALNQLNPTFCKLYPESGRSSIPPKQLLLAMLLQAIYGIRLERMLIEQLQGGAHQRGAVLDSFERAEMSSEGGKTKINRVNWADNSEISLPIADCADPWQTAEWPYFQAMQAS